MTRKLKKSSVRPTSPHCLPCAVPASCSEGGYESPTNLSSWCEWKRGHPGEDLEDEKETVRCLDRPVVSLSLGCHIAHQEASTADIYFLTGVESGKSDIKVPADWFQVTAHFLAFRSLHSCWILTWWAQSELSGVSSCKDRNPTGSGSTLWPRLTLITSQRPRLQLQSHWRCGT